MTDALLHIGLHKTGTTAFQQWASHNADTLRSANGIRFYEAMFGSTHYELGLLAIGPGRTMTGMVLQPEWPLTGWGHTGTFAPAAPTTTERVRHARSRLRQIRQENPIGWPLQLVEAALRRIRLRLTDTA